MTYHKQKLMGGTHDDVEYLPHGLFTTSYDVPKDTPIVALLGIRADIHSF